MRQLRRIDHWLIDTTKRYGLTLLRIALGLVFIWFGLLKVIGRSPVEALVADTMPWLAPALLVPGLGVIEVAVGIGLLALIAVRLTFMLFFLQMVGTFSVLILHPSASFQNGNPLMLSTLGEFVIKNLVLIAAGIALAGHSVAKAHPSQRLPEILLERGTRGCR